MQHKVMKDYKKILEGVVNIINNTEKSDIGFTNICTYIGENCPELKKSEDERIKKALIDYFDDANKADENPLQSYGVHTDKAIAWLEKQGQVKESLISQHENKICKKNDDSLTSEDERIRKALVDIFSHDNKKNCHDEISNEQILSWLEKQGKQTHIDDLTAQEEMDIAVAEDGEDGDEPKSADKFSSKFHECEWITNGDYTWRIIGVTDLDYILRSQDGNIIDDTISHVDEHFHSFTIRDAKDSEVLVCNINKAEIGGDTEKLPNITPTICIYQNIAKDDNYIHTYCSLYNGSSLVLSNSMYYNTFVYNIQPATKEQRDTLMKAIDDAGFTFDFNKKELKKIEPTPAWSEDESKSAYKFKPNFNFKVGQWIVATGKCVYLISKIDGFNVTLVDTNGNESVFDISSLDDAYEWTIADAQNGDVLVEDKLSILPSPFIVIFKMKDSADTIASHCFIGFDGNFYEGEGEHYSEYLHPATKERRDTLEKAMADAGYTFNFEKKELKKIEDEPNKCEGCNNVKGCIACVDGSEWAHIEEQKDFASNVEPKFKIGDKIFEKDFYECDCGTITDIKEGKYIFDNGCSIFIEEQGLWELVEPKFKVGKWYQCTKDFFGKGVTFDKNAAYYCAKEGCLQDKYGCHIAIVKELYDNFKLWHISDAKNGDVLAYVTDEGDLWIMIYWSLYEPYEGHVHYHALLVNDNFSDKGTCCICIDNLKPATKEQRDTLMKAMADAGYTFDFEKKELKKLPVEKNSSTAKSLDDELLEDELEAFLCKYEDVSSEEKVRLIGVAEHFYLIGKNPNANL